MIFCIGEILADMIGTKRGRSIQFECFAGGAPFNVACGIAKLGGNVAFAGCVGDDEIGSFLKNYAAGVANLKSVISTDPTRNTTIAFVTLNVVVFPKSSLESIFLFPCEGNLPNTDTPLIGLV